MQNYQSSYEIDKYKIKPSKKWFLVPILAFGIGFYIFFMGLLNIVEFGESYQTVNDDFSYAFIANEGDELFIMAMIHDGPFDVTEVDNGITINHPYEFVEISVDNTEGYIVEKIPDNTTITFNEDEVIATIKFTEAGTYTISCNSEYNTYSIAQNSSSGFVIDILMMVFGLMGGIGLAILSLIIILIRRSKSKHLLMQEFYSYNNYQEPKDFDYGDF